MIVIRVMQEHKTESVKYQLHSIYIELHLKDIYKKKSKFFVSHMQSIS